MSKRRNKKNKIWEAINKELNAKKKHKHSHNHKNMIF